MLIKQKEPGTDVNDRYILEAGYDMNETDKREGSYGLPIVLNPILPKNDDVLSVQLYSGGKKFNVTISV